MPWTGKRGPGTSRRAVRRIGAAATAVLAVAVCAADARAADEPTGLGIKLPSVEVKLDPVAVKVPSVEVDLAPVQVQVPSVEVELPPVEVTTPSVEARVTPPVSQPEAPASVRTPELPASTTPQAPSRNAAPQSASARGEDVRARETSASGVPAPAGGGDSAVRSGSARGGSGSRRDPTTTTLRSRGDEATLPAVRPRDRRLRRLVRSLSGCLGALPKIETRVLTLRAGGATRRQVARRLDVGVRRVAAAERRGLARLREHARGDGCGGKPATAAALTSAHAGSTTPPATPAASPQARGEAGGGAGAVEGAERSLGGATPEEVTPAVLLHRVGPPLLLLLAGAFVVGFVVNWVRESRAIARRPASS